MTNFTYTDLETYSDVLNAVKAHTADIEQDMVGAFPDNSRSAYLESALAHAELLKRNAEALYNELRSLKVLEADNRAAEATCSCSNPFCQV